MNGKELKYLQVIRQAEEKKITQREAAEILRISERQVRRIAKRLRAEGDGGVAHRSRGKASNRRIEEKLRKKVLQLHASKYGDFGPTLASEKLLEMDKINVNVETLRLWMRQSGVAYKRRRSRGHRQWRARRPCFGAMVQMDGSHHDWLEGRGPRMVLMGYIDDATGKVHGRFYDHEGTLPAFDSFKRYAKRYGIPASLYLDKHTTYKSWKTLTEEEQLAGQKQPLSQFERAMVELGVEVIHANSPQAKGRVERLFGTLQDRLVKEMRLQGIKDKDAANAFLEKYLPVYNRRFSVIAAQPADVHRQVLRGLDLNSILCVKTERRFNNDATVAFDGKFYQIETRVKAKFLTVEERLDGRLRISHRGLALKYRELPARPKRISAKTKPRRQGCKFKPAANHPWRTGLPWSGDKGNVRRA